MRRMIWWSWIVGAVLVLSLTSVAARAAETWPAGTVADTLRQGLNGYTGVDDCYLDQGQPALARGTGSTVARIWLSANGTGINTSTVGLLKFDVTEASSGIPTANTVLRAVLRLTVQGTSTLNQRIPYVQLMRMNRAWGDSTATWDSTGVGSAGTGDWYLGGADSTYADSLYTAGSDILSDPPADRGAKAHASFQVGVKTGSTTSLAVGTIIEFDVTSMVQRWQSSAWTNYGMGLFPCYYGADIAYWYAEYLKLAASEHATAAYRPTLFVWSAPVVTTSASASPPVRRVGYGDVGPQR